MPNNKLSRRSFVQTGAALSAATIGMTAAQAEKTAGANERVRLGVIGIGNRGTQVTAAFLEHNDVEVVAICDVYKPHLEKATAKLKLKADQYNDFREVLDRKDIDAVLIATPDHWHAVQAISACKAGKDVYVEKPLSATIHEGRKMVEAARKYNKVVQVGTHRRSSKTWQKAMETVRTGVLGKITLSQAYRLSNMYPNGIGKRKPSDIPEGLDWDMWLGPRANREYQDNIAPYKFRWWQQYSSQMGNWGVHYLDAMRWALQEQAPTSICAMGGNFAIEDDRTIPDTAQVVFQFASGSLAMFGTYEAFSTPMLQSGEMELRGTNGTMSINGGGIHIQPERRGQFQPKNPEGKEVQIKMPSSNHVDTTNHARNFLDCIKSRNKPNADVEIGHRSTTMSLLANISLATKTRLEWDAKTEKFINSAKANELLHYDYRSPWTLDL